MPHVRSRGSQLGKDEGWLVCVQRSRPGTLSAATSNPYPPEDRAAISPGAKTPEQRGAWACSRTWRDGPRSIVGESRAFNSQLAVPFRRGYGPSRSLAPGLAPERSRPVKTSHTRPSSPGCSIQSKFPSHQIQTLRLVLINKWCLVHGPVSHHLVPSSCCVERETNTLVYPTLRYAPNHREMLPVPLQRRPYASSLIMFRRNVEKIAPRLYAPPLPLSTSWDTL